LIHFKFAAGDKASSIFATWALNPTIFDFLLELVSLADTKETKESSITALRFHCTSHSHFVSSFVSQKNYTDCESPASR